MGSLLWRLEALERRARADDQVDPVDVEALARGLLEAIAEAEHSETETPRARSFRCLGEVLGFADQVDDDQVKEAVALLDGDLWDRAVGRWRLARLMERERDR